MEKNFTFTASNNQNSQTNSFSNNTDLTRKIDFSKSTMSNDIFALAKAFLSISGMTNKKLQKLCYYAKAWYLALYDRNLIFEQFQAWVHGAVQPALYQKYRDYGYNEIPKYTHIELLPEEFVSFAHEVYSSYGHLTGDQLEQLNHQEEPWINARKNCEPWENSSNEISEEDMKQFFRKMIK